MYWYFVPFIEKYYFMVWRYHNLFIHSPANGHLGCLQLLEPLNKAAINIHLQILMWAYIFCICGKMFINGIAGSHDNFMFNFFKELLNCFPKWLHHFLFPPAECESSSCSASLSALGIVSLLIATILTTIWRYCFVVSIIVP